MIKIAITPEMTNVYVPEGWKLTDEPYKAYRAENKEYSVALNLAKDFDETKPSKIIKTEKGAILLVNCPEKEDEKIMLLSLRGDIQSGFHFICLNNIEVILTSEYMPSFSDKYCSYQDLVVRFNDDKSKLILRIGDRTNCHFDKNIVITWDKISREDDYPLNAVLPKNGEVIKGAAFTKYNKDEIEVVEKVANEISSFGLGVLINTYCICEDVVPELLIMKNGNLKDTYTISFCFGFKLERYSEDISRIKNYFDNNERPRYSY